MTVLLKKMRNVIDIMYNSEIYVCLIICQAKQEL